MKLLRTVATVSGLTLLSRIFGLIRDVFFAAFLGAGPVADAFFIAFRLPNFFRRLFAEGALNAAFVPIFSRIHITHGLQVACQYAEQVLALLILVLICFVAAFELSLPYIIDILAPGFKSDPPQLRWALVASCITFPYILFISIAAFYGSILNSLGKFSAASAHPIILNIVMIAAMVCGYYSQTYHQSHLVYWVVCAVPISGILQCLWMYISLRSQGIRLSCSGKLSLNPTIKKLLKAMIPGALGAGVMQINLFVDTLLASKLPSGAISYLYYADRLNQLPLSLLGIGISTVLLPILSRHFEDQQTSEIHALQNRALDLTLSLVMPATLALMVLAQPILYIIFKRAEFSNQDVIQTAHALQAYAFGLPAYVLIKVLSTSFFAQYNTKTPVKIALIAVIFNIILTLILMKPFGHVGIATATAITAWLNVFVLGYKLNRSRILIIDRQLCIQGFKILIASFIMLIGLYCCQVHVFITQGSLTTPYKCMLLTAFIVLGLIIYTIALSLLGGLKLQYLIKFYKKPIT